MFALLEWFGHAYAAEPRLWHRRCSAMDKNQLSGTVPAVVSELTMLGWMYVHPAAPCFGFMRPIANASSRSSDRSARTGWREPCQRSSRS